MKRFLAFGFLFSFLWIGVASAQQANQYWFNGTLGTSCPSCWTPVSPSTPFPGAGGLVQNLPETNTNSTISVTNTFQSALAASTTRRGCWIQNQGTHTMYLYASEANAPTTANSSQRRLIIMTSSATDFSAPVYLDEPAADARRGQRPHAIHVEAILGD